LAPLEETFFAFCASASCLGTATSFRARLLNCWNRLGWPFHLFRYLDEQAFRFNNREMTDGQRFAKVAASVIGKRLTYRELTGKGSAA